MVYQKPSERFLRETELKHSLASEKKYFPDRKRKGKRSGGVDGADGAADADETAATDQTTNLLGDVTGSTQAQSTTNQSVEDLIGLGGPSQPASTPTTTEDLLGIGAPASQPPAAAA